MPDHEEDEPGIDSADEEEWQMECPYCDGDGWNDTDNIRVECPECGGTGWH